MLRMSKLTDYGLVLMTHLAGQGPLPVHSARELSVQAHLPLPTVNKLLKALAAGGLLVSQRGIHGGYRLARPSRQISAAQIVSALEGPIGLTECVGEGGCSFAPHCVWQSKSRSITQVLRSHLERLSLSELTAPAGEVRR